MPFIETDRARVHYRRLGKGPPLLLLAGMASDGASWQPVLDALATRHELWLPDNRGCGQTLDDGAPLSRDILVDDVLALLDSHDLEVAAIIGHSMGAMLGWSVAARAPHRVRRLIPLAGLPTASRARIELFSSLARLRAGADDAHWFRLLFQFLFGAGFFEDPQTVDSAVQASLAYPFRQSVDDFARQAAALETFDTLPPLAGIRCRVHPLCAADDILSPPSTHERFHASDAARTLRASSRLAEPVIVPDAAHAVHWDRPDAVIAHVRRVLAEAD